MARSHTGRPGAAKSKSMIARALPSRNTTFSWHTSLWHSSGPPCGSASSADQGALASNGTPAAAAWYFRSRVPTDARIGSSSAHSGSGSIGTSPGMNSSSSTPSTTGPEGTGAWTNPSARRPRRNGWSAGQLAGAGRSTESPRRNTAPGLAMPPPSGSSLLILICVHSSPDPETFARRKGWGATSPELGLAAPEGLQALVHVGGRADQLLVVGLVAEALLAARLEAAVGEPLGERDGAGWAA